MAEDKLFSQLSGASMLYAVSQAPRNVHATAEDLACLLFLSPWEVHNESQTASVTCSCFIPVWGIPSPLRDAAAGRVFATY